METNKVLTLIFALALMVLVIVGLVNFALFVLLWAKVFVAVVLIGTIVLLVRSLFHVE